MRSVAAPRARPRCRARGHAPALATTGSRTRPAAPASSSTCPTTGRPPRRCWTSGSATGGPLRALRRRPRALYFRPRAETSAPLRRLDGAGVRIGVFTDAPRELADVALAHVGVARRVAVVGTLDEVLLELGAERP